MMRRMSLALSAALFVAAASAQEAFTIKLKERGEGESALITKSEAGSFSVTFVDAKGKTLTQNEKSSDIKEYIETVLKRAGAKLPTKLEREYIKAQSSKGNTVLDWPVIGKTIVIEKKNDQYTFGLKTGETLAAPVAEALAKEFSRKSDMDTAFEKLMLPKSAVKPGDIWKLDMEPIVKDLAKSRELDVTATNARGVGTLQKTYQQDGRLFGVMAYQLVVPVRALGKGPKQVKFTDGARITIESSMDLCIDGTSEAGTTKSKITITGDAMLPGVVATLHIVSELVQIHQLPAKK